MKQAAKTLWQRSVALFLPPTCVVCESVLPAHSPLGFCPSCWGQLPRFDRTTAPELDLILTDADFDDVYTPLFYKDAVQALVQQLKYHDRPQLAAPLARLMVGVLPPCDENTLLIPVPLHTRRLMKRRFNQSIFLARAVQRLSQLGCDVHALRRVKATRTQVGLTAKQRRSQLQDAFVCTRPMPEHVVLVDDVFTTGSTASACARVLKEAGAKRVTVLTAAYTPREEK